jgi:hypothetical protein
VALPLLLGGCVATPRHAELTGATIGPIQPIPRPTVQQASASAQSTRESAGEPSVAPQPPPRTSADDLIDALREAPRL